jgi:hypothetical protein
MPAPDPAVGVHPDALATAGAPDPAAPSFPYPGQDPEPAMTSEVPVVRRRRRSLVVGAVAAVVVVVAVLVATVGSGSDADAAIVTAVNSAVGQKTAHLDITGTGASDGQQVSVTGSGDFDFTHDAAQLVMHVSADGQQEQVQAVYVGETIYEGLPQIAQLAPGKSWVSLDIGSLAQRSAQTSASQLGGNPLTALNALAASGNQVRALGASTVDGQSVQGYAVTISRQAVGNALKSAKVPAFIKQALAQVHTFGITEDVYLGGNGKLVELRESIVENVGSSGTTSLQLSYRFSDYGAPVSITAPPASEVLSFSQFAQLASNSQTS